MWLRNITDHWVSVDLTPTDCRLLARACRIAADVTAHEAHQSPAYFDALACSFDAMMMAGSSYFYADDAEGYSLRTIRRDHDRMLEVGG